MTALLLSSVAISGAYGQVTPLPGQTDLGNPDTFSEPTAGKWINLGGADPVDPETGAPKYFIDGTEVVASGIRASNADLEIRNGGRLILTATGSKSHFSYESNSVSNVVVTGQNSGIHGSHTVALAAYGPGNVTVKDGGAITAPVRVEIGFAGGNQWDHRHDRRGTVVVDGGRIFAGENPDGTRNTTGIFAINGESTLDVINGGRVESADIFYISSRPTTSSATVNVRQGGMIAGRVLRIGSWGKGTLTVDGENSSATGETVIIGNNTDSNRSENATSDGTIIVRNGGTLKATNEIQIGNFGAKGRLVIGALSGEGPAAPGQVEGKVVTFHTGKSELIFNHDAQDYEFKADLEARDVPHNSNPDLEPGKQATIHVENGGTIFSGDVSKFIGQTHITNNASLTLTKTALGGTTTVGENARLVFKSENDIEQSSTIAGNGTIEQAGTGTVSLTGDVSAGKLHASGSGEVALTGNYANIQTAQTGKQGRITLGGSSEMMQGAIENEGLLTINRDVDTTYNGNITGAGEVAHTGAQALTLNGRVEAGKLTANSTGDLIINGDSSKVEAIAIGNESNLILSGPEAITQGQIENNGSLVFDRDVETTFAGSVSGAGQIQQNGEKLILTGDSSAFTGTTTVAKESELRIEGRLGGQVIGDGSIVFDEKGLPEGQVAEQNASFIGNSDINLGGNEQIITGSLEDHTGNILSGDRVTLAGTEDVNSKNITVQNGLVIQGSDSAVDQTRTINSTINSAAGLTVTGPGIVKISDQHDGSQDVVGTLTISNTELQVNRKWGNTDVNIQSGGTLSGNASVNNLRVGDKGRISAGGEKIGTLNVAGNLNLESGSVYDADVRPQSQDSDQVLVGGRATIGKGAILNVRAEGQPVYDSTSNYNVLSAKGGVDGAFDLQGQTKGAFYELRQYTDENNVYLKAVRVRAFGDVATNANQAGVAASIASLVAQDAVWIALYNSMDDAAATRALDLLSGDLHANITGRLVEESFKSADVALDRMFRAEGDGFWSKAYGSLRRSNNRQCVDSTNGGLLIGYDADFIGGVRLGALFGYGQTDYKMGSRDASARSNDFTFGIYSNAEVDAIKIRSGAIYTINEVKSTRNIALPGINETLTSNYTSGTLNAFGEIGYSIKLGSTIFEPFAGLSYVNVNNGSFAEKGGAAALRISNGNTNAFYTNIGIRAEHDFAISNDVQLKATGALTWRHALTNVEPFSKAAFSSGTGFTSSGLKLAKDTFLVEAGLSTALTDQASFGVSYTGEFGNTNTAHSVRAGLNVNF